MEYEFGGCMSDRVSLPLNLALTGPTRATIRTWYWLSPMGSIASQPGTHCLSMAGSLSASQVCCWDAGISCSALISMRGSPGVVSWVRRVLLQGQEGWRDYAPA